jgi:hypothetical protein
MRRLDEFPDRRAFIEARRCGEVLIVRGGHLVISGVRSESRPGIVH